MKILGLLFICCGILFCLTFILMGVGIPMVGVGALLYIAGAITKRNKLRSTDPHQTTLNK